jgi:hypothetical protein
MMVFGQNALSYGALESVWGRWGESHLLFPAYQTGEIRYCLEIGDTRRFPENSISLQVESVLKQWLNAVPEGAQTLAATVRILKVDCKSEGINLEVKIAPDLERKYSTLSAYQQVDRTQRHYFSRVIVNPGILADKTQYRDAVSLLPNSEDKPEQFIQFIESGHYEVDQLAALSGISRSQIHRTTYRVLLHEIGHAFGLCDTYDDGVASCDAVVNSHVHGDSVMKISTQFYLTTEDIEGIREIASLYRGDRNQSYVRSLSFRKAKVADPFKKFKTR